MPNVYFNTNYKTYQIFWMDNPARYIAIPLGEAFSLGKAVEGGYLFHNSLVDLKAIVDSKTPAAGSPAAAAAFDVNALLKSPIALAIGALALAKMLKLF